VDEFRWEHFTWLQLSVVCVSWPSQFQSQLPFGAALE
jgi:hypothetical protein